jgi:hypothetical protein
MSRHKEERQETGPQRMGSAQLRARRRRLAARLSDPTVMLSGSLVSQTRSAASGEVCAGRMGGVR